MCFLSVTLSKTLSAVPDFYLLGFELEMTEFRTNYKHIAVALVKKEHR